MIATRHKQLGRGTGFGVGEAGDPQFTISAGHEHAVAYTLKIRSGCDGGGKGALIQEDKSATLATNNDQYLFQPIAISSKQQSLVSSENLANTLGANDYKEPQVVCQAVIDSNILDDQGGQQITVRTDGKAPTLRAETHGNIPAVMEPVTIEPGIAAREGGHIYEGVSGTLRANAGDNQMAVAYAAGFNYLQGSKARTIGFEMEKAGTLRAGQFGDAVLVKMEVEGFDMYNQQSTGDNAEILEDKSPCLNCNHEQPIVFDKEVYNSGVNATGGHYIAEGGPAPTLRTSVPPGVCVQYIVRRLTPTECARLQGFPDDWGHPDHKDDFTDEEYRFWLDVRNTHAAINGKPQKDYTKAQMLTWYNKLHTDSSEYKMWGNGISLPTALYVMQGIAEALKGGEG